MKSALRAEERVGALKSAVRGLANGLRLRGPLADDPTARILHALVVCILLWLVLEFALAVPFALRKAVSALLLTFEAAMLFCSWALLQRGRIRAASLVYLSATWLIATVVTALNGGVRSPALVLYIALPISAAWLLGYRATLWVTAACLATSLGMGLLEVLGKPLPRLLPGTPVGIWFVVLFATIISTVPVARVLRILKEILAASQRDITERTRAEEELRKHKEHLQELVEQRTSELVVARDEAQAANRAKSAFLAKMSHELRTPLSAILGFSSLLGRELNLNDRQRGDLDIINRSGGHLLELINDLLDVFKIEAGRTAVQSAPLDLVNLVSEVMGLMSVRAEEKGLNLVLNGLSDAPKYIRSDSAKLRQILINLVGNAIKYTEQGSVRVKMNAGKRAHDTGVLLTIDVEDTGIGIAAEDQVRIFDPFVQAGDSNSPSGTGLGLSITGQLLKLMNGTITVESIPDTGSVFRVSLPVQLSGASEVISSTSRTQRVIRVAPEQQEYRILIVEDESANTLLLERLLGDAGFRVLVASNGVQGVKAFREWRPHFIWMDRQMPVMDGLEAVRQIRAMGESDVKIAAISASVLPDEHDQVMAAGFDDFVNKPFTAEAIFSCMARHLSVRYLLEELPDSSSRGMKPLAAEELASIPEHLRAQLENALITLDVKRIARVIDRVSETAPALGSLLANHAGRYAFTSMLRSLQGSDCKSVGKG